MTLALDIDLPPRVREAATMSAAAERDGFGCGWIPETTSDPFPVAASALLSTGSLRVGTAVAVAFARTPFATAQAAWELSRCSSGRFTLGLGTQVKAHVERRFSTRWDKPTERLQEYIEVVRACWRAFSGAAPLRFEGRFYRVDLLTDHFDPGPIPYPDIPIAVAGVNPGMGRIAGALCDGLVCHPLHSRRYLRDVLIEAVAEGARSAGRTREQIQILAPVWVVTGTGPERDSARETIRRQIALYGATRTYRRVFATHGWDEVPTLLHTALGEGGPAAAAAFVDDEMIETFAVCAPVDELASAIQERLDGLADRTMVYSPVPSAIADRQLRDLAAQLSAERRRG